MSTDVATLSMLSAVAHAEPAPNDVRALFVAQRANRWTMAQTSAAERRARLLQFKAAILAQRPALFRAFAADFGKPAVEVETLEIQPVLAEIDMAVASLEGWMRPKPVATPLLLFRARSEVRAEPKGLVLIMGPWNYPLLLLLSPLVSAVAAGNCAIIRPSEKVPHVVAAIGQIVAAVFPANEVALVGGEIAVAEALLELPFDHFFYTGGGPVGRKVMQAAAAHLASVTLELGGKSPAIIDLTANMAQAAERIVWGKFINAGQTCVAPDYVLVHESQANAFVAAAKRVIARFYGPDEQARLHNADLAQIIDMRAFSRLTNLRDAAIAAGAQVAVGGQASAERRVIGPTLLTNVAPDNPIMAEEIFGPLLPILTYRTLDEALALIDAKDKPLALYIFSQNRPTIARILRQTTAGGTLINSTIMHLGNFSLPFGGVGPSGSGNYHGEFGFRAFSHERAVLTQLQPSLLSLYFPPYTRATQAIVRLTTNVLYRVLPRLRKLW